MAHTFRGQERRERAGRRQRRHPLTPRQKARAAEVAVLRAGRVDPATRPVAKSGVGRGTVVLAGVDFVEGDGRRKIRPVLILDDATAGRGATWPALQLGSSAARRGFLTGSEFRIDCDFAGIERDRTVVHLDRVVEVAQSDVYRVVGHASDDDLWSIAALRPDLPGTVTT